MNLQLEKKPNYTLIRPKVEKLDSNVAPHLKSELVILNSSGVKNIIIDLAEVRYCDSSGLSAILVANRLCRNSKGAFVLTGVQDAVKKLITISQLDSILTITISTQEATDMMKV